MTRVYIVQSNPNLNFSPAIEYGDLVFLLPNGNLTVSLPAISKTIKRNLALITQDDYLLLSGDPIAMALTVLIALTDYVDAINLLKYDRINHNYNVERIDKADL